MAAKKQERRQYTKAQRSAARRRADEWGVRSSREAWDAQGQRESVGVGRRGDAGERQEQRDDA